MALPCSALSPDPLFLVFSCKQWKWKCANWTCWHAVKFSINFCSTENLRLESHSLQLETLRANVNSLKCSFFRTVCEWNNLSENNVSALFMYRLSKAFVISKQHKACVCKACCRISTEQKAVIDLHMFSLCKAAQRSVVRHCTALYIMQCECHLTCPQNHNTRHSSSSWPWGDARQSADYVGTSRRCVSISLRQLRPVVRALSGEARKTVVHAFVSSRLDYCNSVVRCYRQPGSTSSSCSKCCRTSRQ